ncbi:hypothetical protein ACR6HW_14925 [Fusibacter sp. JL298sf-3]
MQGYRLTKMGKGLLAVLMIVFIAAVVKGTVYFAVFGFVFCALMLSLMVYEVFFNR